MMLRSSTVTAVLFLAVSLNAQVVCIDCYQQTAPINTGQLNLLLNGSFESGCGGSGNFCPIAWDYSCDVTNWTCTGGGTSTYCQAIDAVGGWWGVVADGNYALYFGNWFCNPCSNNQNDTSCFLPADCGVTGIPQGFPVNLPEYGNATGLSLEQTVNGLTPGGTYKLEFWTGGEDFGSFLDLGIFGLDIGFGPMVLRCDNSGTGNTGTRYVVTFLATASSHTIKFTNWGHMTWTATELILDDVQLFESYAVNASFTMTQLGNGAVDCINTSLAVAPTYLWDMGDGTTYYTEDVLSHVYPGAGPYTITLIVTDTTACNQTDTATTNIVPMAVVSTAESLVLEVYPNPTNNLLQIRTNAFPAVIILTDVAGREVQRATMTSEPTVLDVGQLPKGTYFVRPQHGERESVLRWVKE